MNRFFLSLLWCSAVGVLSVGCGSGSSSDDGNSSSGGAGGFDLTSPYTGELAINELTASNHTGLTDESGAYPDWIELYNSTGDPIDLGGFYISDKSDDYARAVIPAGVVVPAGGVVVLIADGDVDQGSLHLSFKLSAAGEGVYLSDPDLKLIDAVEYPSADADTSYARLPDGTGSFHWCVPGTPGQLNGDSC